VAYSQVAASGWRVSARILNKFSQTAAGPNEDVSGSKEKISLWVYLRTYLNWQCVWSNV